MGTRADDLIASTLTEGKKHGRIGAMFQQMLDLRAEPRVPGGRTSQGYDAYPQANRSFWRHAMRSLQRESHSVFGGRWGAQERGTTRRYPSDAQGENALVKVPEGGEWRLSLRPGKEPGALGTGKHRLHVNCNHCERTVPVGRLEQHMKGKHYDEFLAAEAHWGRSGQARHQARLERQAGKPREFFTQAHGNCGLIAPRLAGHHGAQLPPAPELRHEYDRILNDHKLKLRHVNALASPKSDFRDVTRGYAGSTVEVDIKQNRHALETALGDHLPKESRGAVIDHLLRVANTARRGVLPAGHPESSAQAVRDAVQSRVGATKAWKDADAKFDADPESLDTFVGSLNAAKADEEARHHVDRAVRSAVHQEAVRMLEHSARSIRPESESGHYITVSGSFEPVSPGNYELTKQPGDSQRSFHVAFEHGTHGQLNYGAHQGIGTSNANHGLRVIGRIPLKKASQGAYVPSSRTHGCYSCDRGPGEGHDEARHEQRAKDSSPQHSIENYERIFGK